MQIIPIITLIYSYVEIFIFWKLLNFVLGFFQIIVFIFPSWFIWVTLPGILSVAVFNLWWWTFHSSILWYMAGMRVVRSEYIFKVLIAYYLICGIVHSSLLPRSVGPVELCNYIRSAALAHTSELFGHSFLIHDSARVRDICSFVIFPFLLFFYCFILCRYFSFSSIDFFWRSCPSRSLVSYYFSFFGIKFE